LAAGRNRTALHAARGGDTAPRSLLWLGKVKEVSLPHAPGATVYWTTYTYDALGRTVTVTKTDGSATNYVY